MSSPTDPTARTGRVDRPLWHRQGAQVRDGGVDFAVWAPHAQRVQVVGDFNGWDGGQHDMYRHGDGLWTIEIDGIGSGTHYKYAIHGADGQWVWRADPLARHTEVPPDNASVVFASTYTWGDDEWMAARPSTRTHAEAMSVYEVHLGSWRQGLSYAELADQLTQYVLETGFTHVELMPVMEHPFGGSWGYQVTGYYAPTSRFGDPDDFRALVDALHAAGIGVIVDWVPAHFPRDEWALARFDGTPLYEDPNPQRGEHPEWGTLIFNFGHPQIRDFLISNALYWLEEFHIDGLRVDAVASMIYLDYSREPGSWTPNHYGGRENLEAVSFLQELNAACYAQHDGIAMIAEESTAWPGVTRSVEHDGLGFGLKWNLGWMHDSLDYFQVEPVSRSYHHNQLTFSMMYAYAENFLLPLSHDEVVHGKGSLLRKMPGGRREQFANLRAYFAFMWAHPGKKLLFMGGEFGQYQEWADGSSLEWGSLDDHGHSGVRRLVDDMNRQYRAHSALWALDYDPEGFGWIDADDKSNNVMSFVRSADGNQVVCVANFAGLTHEHYRFGLPGGGRWRVILDTDDEAYGGYGALDCEEVWADDEPCHGRAYSAQMRLPALSVVWLEHAPQ